PNAGSAEHGTRCLGFNTSAGEMTADKTMKALRQFLPSEFLVRVVEVIVFQPLGSETLEKIAALMLEEYRPGMEAKGIAYRYTPAALKALVAQCEGGKFGAREIGRASCRERGKSSGGAGGEQMKEEGRARTTEER